MAILRTDLPLSVDSLTFIYGGTSNETAGIDDVTFALEPGEFVSVVGPSGCGKSTLLSIIAGLTPGYKGQVLVNGTPMIGPRREVGVVFQEESTFPWRTARRNIEFGLEMRKVPKVLRRKRADEMLDLMGLSGFDDYYPAQLSGGMRQRVAIARTLLLEPTLLLMDEPFGALDEQTRLVLGEELLRIQQALNQTVLFITHNIQEAIMLSDRVVVLTHRPGKVAAVIDVGIDRPRSADSITQPHFIDLVGRVWAIVKKEAQAAILIGSQRKE